MIAPDLLTFTTTPELRRLDACRVCGGDVDEVLDLGRLPLANGLLRRRGEVAPTYPLAVTVCCDCGHAQLRHVVAPELLFGDYLYYTSASRPMAVHFGRLADRIVSAVGRGRILEIGSNDGTLLEALETRGCRVAGIDPAPGPCALARRRLRRGIVVEGLWDEARARALGRFDAVVAANVLGHVDDVHAFIAAAVRCLRISGRLVIEVQDASALVRTCAFDTIYHEHLSVFGEASLTRLLADHGLTVESCEHLTVHCGSLRVVARLSDSPPAPSPRLVPDWERVELETDRRRRLVVHTLEQAQEAGQTVACYGAPAKATVALNVFGLSGLVDFAVDTTPEKLGRWIPGVQIPIVDRAVLDEAQVALLACWNYRDELLVRERSWLERGGRLLTYCPDVRIIDGTAKA